MPNGDDRTDQQARAGGTARPQREGGQSDQVGWHPERADGLEHELGG